MSRPAEFSGFTSLIIVGLLRVKLEAEPNMSTKLELITDGADVARVEAADLMLSATVELNRVGSVKLMKPGCADSTLLAGADRTLGEELVTSKSDRP